MIKNAYIHIPFCKSKCHYCSFVSFADLSLKTPTELQAKHNRFNVVGLENPTYCPNQSQYLEALISQIKSEYKDEKLNTLYFGGGTPSLLTVEKFQLLIGLFNFEDDAEITVEVNPDSVDLKYLQELKILGINRLSIGVQTFDDKVLQLIGRRHNSAQTKFALNCAKEAGFENISIDLIYGLPTQTLKDFEKDLQLAVKSGVQHISLYGLKIEEGCYFYKNMPAELANSDIQADMYLKAIKVLKTAGFEHYEISNFSLPDFNSRHNLNYWDNNTYYGFGCGASGYTLNLRYTNEVDLEKYIKTPLKKIAEQKLTQKEILEEAIFLGLRKIAGINIEKINKNFAIDFDKKYAKILDKYSQYFIKTSEGYKFTIEGILISNEILLEFID
mgnify:CR=1 FL=1